MINTLETTSSRSGDSHHTWFEAFVLGLCCLSLVLLGTACGGGVSTPVIVDEVTIQADPITPITESVSLIVFGLNRPPALVRFYLDNLFLGDDATGPEYAILVPRSRLPTNIDPLSRWRVEVVDANGTVVSTGSTPVSFQQTLPPPGADLRFANLNDGDTIGGIVSIRVESHPDPDWIRLFLDQVLISESKTVPALFTLDTQRYSNGDHIISAVARYPSGGILSRHILIEFSNTPPAVPENWLRFLSPEPNGPLSGAILLHVEASTSTTRVRFYVDGDLVFDDFEPEYNYVLDTTAYSDGSHLIEARADFTDSGHGSVAVVVIFDNTPDPPPPPTSNPFVIVSPEDNSTVTGVFPFEVIPVNDQINFEEVEFYIDGHEIGKKISPPFSISVDPIQLRLNPGWHTLLVSAEVEMPAGLQGRVALEDSNKFYASVRVNYQPTLPLYP